MTATLSGAEPVRLPWVTLLAFLRISTNPRILRNPLTTATATGIASSWLARPGVATLAPGAGYWSILCRLLESAQARGPLVMDAHLAALAIENGALLCSADSDFARFAGLRWHNPLREEPAA